MVFIIFRWRMWLFLFNVNLTPQSLFLNSWNCASYFRFHHHGLSHKEHKQAHSKAESIEKIVTTGIYSKIRHPGYLGLILMYLGVAFLFHNILAIVGSIILSSLQILTALAEEKYLIKKLREEYEEYMRRVDRCTN